MTTRKLALACPACGATDVFYTCTPNCCFNHVCGTCGATFEPVTKATGRTRTDVLPPDPAPEATDPTVACARCDSTSVGIAGDGTMVCAGCGSVLELEFSDVQRN